MLGPPETTHTHQSAAQHGDRHSHAVGLFPETVLQERIPPRPTLLPQPSFGTPSLPSLGNAEARVQGEMGKLPLARWSLVWRLWWGTVPPSQQITHTPGEQGAHVHPPGVHQQVTGCWPHLCQHPSCGRREMGLVFTNPPPPIWAAGERMKGSSGPGGCPGTDLPDTLVSMLKTHFLWPLG